MQRRKDWVRFIALFMSFVLLLGSVSFGAIGREFINWNRRHPRNVASSSNPGGSSIKRASGSSVGTPSSMATPNNPILLDVLDNSLINLTNVILTDWSNQDLESPVEPDAEVRLRFEFQISDAASGGDYAYIHLPEEITFSLDQVSNDNWYLNIYDEDCILLKTDKNPDASHGQHEESNPDHQMCLMFVVTYDKAEHAFKITFTDYMDKGIDDKWGYFYLDGHFNKTYIEDNEQSGSISFGEGEFSYDYEIVFKEEDPKEVFLYKSGKSLGHNPETDTYEIEWTIKVDFDGEAKKGFHVFDQLPKELSYLSETTSIFSFDGTELDLANWDIVYDNIEKTIKWTYLGEDEIEDGVNIIFTTSIDSIYDLNKSSSGLYTFKNKAKYTDKQVEAEDEAKVEIDFKFFVKTGSYNAETRSITWEVTINSKGLTFQNSTITVFDEIPAGLTLKEDTVSLTPGPSIAGSNPLYTLETSDSGNPPWRDNNTGSRIVIKLGELYQPINQTYKLKYETAVDEEFYDAFVKGNKQFNNIVYVTAEYGPGHWLGTLPDVGKGVGAYNTTLSKSATKFNPQDALADNSPTIDWTINLDVRRSNPDAQFMLEDVPADGLVFMDNSITSIQIKSGGKWVDLDPDDDYAVTFNSDYTKMNIEFAAGVSGQIRIFIKNKVVNYDLLRKNTAIRNYVYLYEKLDDEWGDPLLSANNSFSRKFDLVSKSSQYNYQTKVFQYTIQVNEAYTTSGNVEEVLYLPGISTMTDTLPEGMRIVENTLDIKDGKFVITDGISVTVDPVTDRQILTIAFEDLDETVTVTFNATFTKDYLDTRFQENKTIAVINAVELDTTPFTDPFTDSDYKNVENKILSKTAKSEKGDGFIDWTVYINMNGVTKENLKTVRLTDTLQDGLVLAVDTVALYKATLTTWGSFEYKEEDRVDLSANNIQYSPPPENKFIFTFPEKVDVSSPYVLKYSTDINPEEPGTYKNNIVMEGYYTYYSEASSEYEVDTSGGSGSGTRRGRELKVLKIDSETQQSLPGAQFELTSDLGGTRTAISDENGIATFTEVMATTTYTLTEASAPEGYIITDEPVTITSDITEVTFKNTRIKGNVEITKYGEDGQTLLDGAEFTVYHTSNQAIFGVFTTVNGKAVIEDLLYGVSYTIKETKAPEGYLALGELGDYTFEFESNGDTIDLIYDNNAYVKNTKQKGNVEFTKQNNSGAALTGARFQLKRDTEWDKEHGIASLNEFTKFLEQTSTTEGKVLFENVDYGKYIIEEVEAPYGYDRNFVKVGTVIVTEDEVQYQFEPGIKNKIIINDKLQGSVTLMKIDADADNLQQTLRGAEFELRRIDMKEENYSTFTPVYKMVTNNVGIASLQVDFGTYEVVETEAPTGYVKGSGTIEPQTITVGKGENNSISILATNEKIKGSVEILKTDSNGNNLDNASFVLVRTNDFLPDGYKKDYNPGILGPTKDGYAKLDDVEYGRYDVYELTSPDGYQIIKTKIDEIVISKPGDTVSVNAGKAVVNEKITGSLELQKVSEAGIDGIHHPLAGAKFRLIRDNKDLPQHFEEDLMYEITTDADGKASLAVIEYGTYQVYEIQAPAGYSIDDDYLKNHIGQIKISEQDQFVTLIAGDEYPLLANKRYTGDIEITKKGEADAEGNRPLLAGAEFRLERIEDTLDDGFQTAYNLKTGADGIARLSGVEFGSYKIYETKAPTGYKSVQDAFTDEQGEPIIIRVGTDSNAIMAVELYNEIIRQDLLVIKTNTNGTNKLRGAKFQLYQVADVFGPLAEERLLYDDLTTDENGEIRIGDLAYGEYYLNETKAPSGYRLPVNSKTYFKVDTEDQLVQITITNSKSGSGGGNGGGTPTTEAPQPSTENPTTPGGTDPSDPSGTVDPSESSSRPTLPGDEGYPGTGLPPGYTYEYDEETGQFLVIDPNGIPLGWFNNMEDILSAIPKTGDSAPIVLFVILLAGAGAAIVTLTSKKKCKKDKMQ